MPSFLPRPLERHAFAIDGQSTRSSITRLRYRRCIFLVHIQLDASRASEPTLSLRVRRVEYRHPNSHLLTSSRISSTSMYYQDVRPIFPFLPARTTLDTFALSNTSENTLREPHLALFLALCSYTGRLSSSFATSSTSSVLGLGLGTGNAGKNAANLWCEQAHTIMVRLVRTKSILESPQILCTLRDQRRGNKNQGVVFARAGSADGVAQPYHLAHQPPSPPRYCRSRATRQAPHKAMLVMVKDS